MRAMLICSLFLISSCQKSSDNQGLTWLNLPDNGKFLVIEKQFRGFDVTMVEVGYRYNELYWAGEDQNWELAEYHLDKIGHTMKLGLDRRPKRRASAEMIFPILENLTLLAKEKDRPKFREEFKTLKQACINCHQAEGVPFFKVGIPKVRLSPIGL